VKIEKLTSVPAAFEGIAAKVNEVIAAHPPLKAGENVTITQSEEHTLVSATLSSDASIQRVLAAGRTFFVNWTGGTSVAVSPGAINNVFYAGGNFTVSNGDDIYIDATVDAAGTVTALTVSKAASVPSSTTTHAYTALATIAVSGGIATVTPVAWNYSQVQRCGGGSTYYWGGFGA
jgi:hypothetical protein